MSHIEPWLRDYLPSPETGLALDIGANEGDWTARLAERCSAVHAFEPNPQVFPALRSSMASRLHVRLFDLALGATVGDLELDLYEKSEWATSYHKEELDAWRGGDPIGSLTVPMASLDSLGYASRPVEFIKVDVEGAECEVLAGADRTVAEQHPALLIEIHSAPNKAWVVDFCDGHGYEASVIPHPHAGVPEGHCWITA